ncbi:MAG: Hsp20/alpha crystallin family protein [Candidatus Poribacteria bacterium]
MRLTLWDPFKELMAMQRALDSAFTSAKITYPPVDVVEKEDKVQIVATLPGVDKESLDLTILGDTLTIAGEKKSSVQDGITYIRRERPFGKFRKLIDLPFSVDQEKITATYNNGILTITMAKAESAMPKQIKVE